MRIAIDGIGFVGVLRAAASVTPPLDRLVEERHPLH
jgi:hypothetical protein